MVWYLLVPLLILFIIGLLVTSQVVRQVRNLKVYPPRVVPCDRDDLPSHLRGSFDQAEEALASLGFEFDHCSSLWDLLAVSENQRWTWVFRHPVELCYATVVSPPLPDPNVHYALEFSAHYGPEDTLVTVQRMAHTLVPGMPGFRIVDPYGGGMDEQWQAHCAAMAAISTKPQLSSAAEYRRNGERFLARYLDHLRKQGWLERTADGEGFGYMGSLGFALRILRGAWRSRRSTAVDVPPERAEPTSDLPEQMAAYQRLEALHRKRPLGWLPKTLLFLASVLLFALIGGSVFSFEFVLILILVLVFHEFGHLAAMRLFGYKDLSVLMVPMLGALAMGERDDARPWQRTLVYLAGPLPGLILGMALLHWAYLAMDQKGLLCEFGFLNGLLCQFGFVMELVKFGLIMVAINWLNLLPIFPLDGGQILRLLILRRLPFAEAIFVAASTVAVALAALYLEEPWLWLLVALLALGVPAEARRAKLLRRLRRRLADDPSAGFLPAALTLLGEAPYRRMPFVSKFHLIRSLRDGIQPAAGLGTIGLGVAAWIASLAGPWFFAVPLLHSWFAFFAV